MKNFIKEQYLFWKELKNNPSAIGAAFPSSKKLGQVMAAQIPQETTGLIVELGAGTGSITKCLLEKFASEQLIIVERAKQMCLFLQEQYPNIKIICGDAIDLATLIKSYQVPVSVIISSLPLRSMLPEVVAKIEIAALSALIDKGLFIQFTYDLRNNATRYLPNFQYLYHKNVLLNMPPAKVDVYQKSS